MHKHPLVGVFSAIALTGHSFLDGVGIGPGFQVNNAVGLAVAVAVIAHDFSNGLNTVTLMMVGEMVGNGQCVREDMLLYLQQLLGDGTALTAFLSQDALSVI